MKRGRSASKSAENAAKEEPPKKVQKKRLKTQSSIPCAPIVPVNPSPDVVQLKPPKSSVKLGSLPMYGEQVPEKGYNSVPELAEKTCSDIRTAMAKIRDFKLSAGSVESEIDVCKQKGLVNFVNLKKLNRLSHMYCKDAREQTQEQKLEADNLHLQLQNLMYEAMHLRKEITNCLEFKSQHEDIDLISADELLLMSTTDEISDDEHGEMLRRLEWELQQRGKLALQQGAQEMLIAKELADIKTKEEKLNSILPALEGIRKATLPLQNSLGVPLDKKRDDQEMALLLPSSLYVFFMQAKAYSDIQDSSLSVTVSGDIGEAKVFQTNELDKSDDESGESDNEGEKNKRKKHRKQDKSAIEKKISKAHPLSIICDITLQELGSFQITFSFLPHFNVVCASVSSISVRDIPDNILCNYLDKSCLLHCLVDGDTGRTSPNAIVSFHIRKHGKEVFSSAVRTYGFPYKWVQRLCGISDSIEVANVCSPEQQVEVSAENVGLVVHQFKQRFHGQVYLLHQLISLGSDIELLPTDDINKSNCKLMSWKQTTNAELQSLISQFVSQSIFNVQERMNRFYLGTFQCESAELECLMCVGADYPATPPAVAINIVLSEGEDLQEIQIKSIEADINVLVPKSVRSSDKHGKYLLYKQIHRLQNCFQVFMNQKKYSATQQKANIKGKGRLLVLKK